MLIDQLGRILIECTPEQRALFLKAVKDAHIAVPEEIPPMVCILKEVDEQFSGHADVKRLILARLAALAHPFIVDPFAESNLTRILLERLDNGLFLK